MAATDPVDERDEPIPAAGPIEPRELAALLPVAAGALLCAGGRVGLVAAAASAYAVFAGPELTLAVFDRGRALGVLSAVAVVAALVGAGAARGRRARAASASAGIAVLVAGLVVAIGALLLHPALVHEGIVVRLTPAERAAALGPLLGAPHHTLALGGAALVVGLGLVRLAAWSRFGLLAFAAVGAVVAVRAEALVAACLCLVTAGALCLPRASALFRPELRPRPDDLRWYLATVHAGLVAALVLGVVLRAYVRMFEEVGVSLPRAAEVLFAALGGRGWWSLAAVLSITLVPALVLGLARRSDGFRAASKVLSLAAMTAAAAVALVLGAMLARLAERL